MRTICCDLSRSGFDGGSEHPGRFIAPSCSANGRTAGTSDQSSPNGTFKIVPLIETTAAVPNAQEIIQHNELRDVVINLEDEFRIPFEMHFENQCIAR